MAPSPAASAFEACGPPPDSAIAGPAPSYDPTGNREYLADFATERHVTDLSLSAFPDALAFDPTVAFAAGPVAHADASGGLTAKAWRARFAAGEVLLASTDGETWMESPLFAVPGAAVSWLALAFDGSGRAVIAAERETGPAGGPELWVYHFNPAVPGFVLESFGYGRTPIAVLDDTDPTAGDVQVFYIGGDGYASHRQQRSRYNVAVATPLLLGPGGRLARAARVEGDRLAVWGVVRDAAAGRWTLASINSRPYPSRHDERVAFTISPHAGRLDEIPRTVPERMVFAVAPLNAELRSVIFAHSADERMVFAVAPLAGELREVVRVHSADEHMTFTVAPLGGELREVVIAYAQDDRMTFTVTPLQGTLETV